jgi:two-component system, NarL family, nitrate/nitrite response regulator NarL
MVNQLIKILLADDHALFRDALVLYIERAFDNAELILKEDFSQARKALAVDSSYNLILLDYQMPGMQGLEGLKILAREYPDIPIALMSGVADPETVAQALEAGASAYFPKTLSGKDLLESIKRVLSGERYVPLDQNKRVLPSHFADDKTERRIVQEVVGRDFNSLGNPALNGVHTAKQLKLTPREKEVLQYVMRGQPNKEIANALGLQLVTIKLHVRGICNKLNVSNRTQAAIRARELGLFHHEP